jgi:cytochrome c oxidase subunit 2
LVSVVLAQLAQSVAFAADVAAGKSGYAVCAACHGPNGAGSQPMNSPRLTGQFDWYLKTQIQAFKDGTRGGAGDIYGAQMRPMASVLGTDAAVDNVVAYIGTLTAPVSAPTVKGDVGAGKQLFADCVECHGAKAEGNVAKNAPRLLDQEDWYLVRQVQNFKSGVRGGKSTDENVKQMMAKLAKLSNDQAINDVVVYIRSLK